MIKEKENLLFRKRHFCLGSFQLIGKNIFPVQLVKLVDLSILSCLFQAFAMSSDIKNDLLNPQKYLIVGETSSSSTKVAKEMRNKYQKKK